MKYQCEIKERNGGIWEKKETPKTITFTYTDKLHFEPNYTKIRISKTDKFYGDVLRDWGDGTYIAYPRQAGIPYYFKPIEEKLPTGIGISVGRIKKQTRSTGKQYVK